LVCDFFCQPAVPVPMTAFDSFAESVAGILSQPEEQIKRFKLLLPLYQVKWCCILLNDFLPTDSTRRAFARVSSDRRKEEQLAKASYALAGITG